MLRRAARERREFIYKKTVEQRQKAIEDKRERLKSALEGIYLIEIKAQRLISIKPNIFAIFFSILKENRLIPTDLRKEALELQKNIDWKDPGADGEYIYSLSQRF